MRLGPVFREGLEVYLAEGHGFAAYFYLLILLAPAVFLALFIPSLDTQVWMGPAELFKVSSSAALVLIVYFALRIANQEFAPWRFVTLRRRLDHEKLTRAEIARDQLATLFWQAALLVLLAAPLLVWAAAVARVPAGSIFFVLLLLFFYALAYGVWGLAALALWERKLEVRQVFVRALLTGAICLTAAFYRPLNPVAFVVYYLRGRGMAPLVLRGYSLPAGAVHFAAHALLLAAGLFVYFRALRREASS